MRADRGPEEPADRTPFLSAGREARSRQQQTGVRLPGEMPYRVAGHQELQARHCAAWSDDTADFAQCCGRISHVAEQISEGEGIERLVAKWQLLGPARSIPDSRCSATMGNTPATAARHLASDSYARHRVIAAGGEHEPHSARAGGHIQDVRRIG